MMRHDVLDLNEIEECKHKYPNEVHKVPVQTNLFHHLITSATIVHSGHSSIIDQEVEHHTAEYVKTVETCDEEKEVCEIVRAVLVLVKVRALYVSRNPLAVNKIINR